MARAAGFWSYTHQDDLQDGGRITRLATLLRNEYELLTAEELTLFVDRDAIQWGDEWRTRIEEALAGTTFFIPIITPRFFQSLECRRELLRFAGEARSLGLEELLLPVLYVAVPPLSESNPEDEALALIASTQWVDWRSLRLVDETSAEYRQGVNGLAQRLADISQRLESIPTSRASALEVTTSEGLEGEPGYLDLIAASETLLPQLSSTVQEIGTAIEELGSAAGSDELNTLDARNAPMSQRLGALRRTAERMEQPASRIRTLGSSYASQLIEINPSILAFFRILEEGAEVEIEDAGEFFDGIASMAVASRQAGTSLSGLIGTMQPLARWSRDLRSPIKKVEQGLRSVLDGQAILDEWEEEANRWKNRGEASGSESQ